MKYPSTLSKKAFVNIFKTFGVPFKNPSILYKLLGYSDTPSKSANLPTT